jgi:hypothetical protein
MARLFVPVAAFVAGLMLAACSNGVGAPSSDAPASGAGRSMTSAATSTSDPSTAPVEPTAQPPVPGGTPRSTKLAAPPVGTGINGTTVVDGCPVMRDPPCPDKPVPARLSVLESSTGAVIATVDSDANGHFSIALKPGQYLLRLANTAGALPRQASPAKVTVETGHYTTVTVRLDSGMR